MEQKPQIKNTVNPSDISANGDCVDFTVSIPRKISKINDLLNIRKFKEARALAKEVGISMALLQARLNEKIGDGQNITFATRDVDVVGYLITEPDVVAEAYPRSFLSPIGIDMPGWKIEPLIKRDS